MSAVHDAVQRRVGQGGVSNDLVPAADRDLAGDQQRAAVVAVVNDLEQIATLLGIERLRPPIIDDQEPDAFECGEQPRQAALAARLGQIAEQAAGALIEYREALAACLVAEGTSQPRLADTGRSSGILPGVRRLKFGSSIRFTRATVRPLRRLVSSAMPARSISSSGNPIGRWRCCRLG